MQNVYNKDRDSENLSKEKISDFADSAVRQGEQKMRNVASEAEKQIRQGEEQLKKMFASADKQLHENPWPVVTTVAIGCLTLGFIMGLSKKS